MRIYNTQTKKIEEFRPINPGLVKMYVCGPTVYDHSHIGHGRIYVFYDFLERYLRYKGYDVIKTINITDIDDKIINKANQLGISVKQLTEEMTYSFLRDYIDLNCLIPEFMPRATHHINEMINIISKLIEKGYAYTVNGDVYFDISKFKSYGELSHQKIEDLIAGQRIEPGERKKSPLDFALWKSKKPGEPCWETPWGEGRPGWHIECTAMSMKLLGETIDIHGGGADLIFPHHENEKTQSEAYSGKRFVRYWIHVGLVKLEGKEMSKSTGNIVLLREAIKKYGSDTLRIMYLKTHYRAPLDFTWEKLEEAKNIADKLKRTYKKLKSIKPVEATPNENTYLNDLDKTWTKITEALDNDLNTPLAISELMSIINLINTLIAKNKLTNRILEKATKILEDIKYIFGLKLEERRDINQEKLIEILINVRKQLREKREYELADYIRNRLREMGIILEDKGRETTYYLE